MGIEMVEFAEIQRIAELIQKAQMLFAKYVAIGAAFEVNVSWQVRKRAMATLANLEAMDVDDMQGTDLLKTVKAIYGLFTPVMVSMQILLSSSYIRFQSTQLFLK